MSPRPFGARTARGPVCAGGVPQDEKAVALFEGELVGALRIVAVEGADGVVGQMACGLGEVLVLELDEYWKTEGSTMEGDCQPIKIARSISLQCQHDRFK